MKNFISKYIFRINPHSPGHQLLKEFDKLFAGATNIDWSRENDGIFEVIFRINGIEHIAWFEESGKWLKTEINYRLEMLDTDIRKKLEKYGQIMSSIFTKDSGNKNGYEFIIRDNFQVRHVFITDEKGNIIERRTFDESELL